MLERHHPERRAHPPVSLPGRLTAEISGCSHPPRPVHGYGVVRLQGVAYLTFVSWLNCLCWTGSIPGVVYQMSKSERRA